MVSFEGVLWPGELSCANLVAIGSNCSLNNICDIGIFFTEAGAEEGDVHAEWRLVAAKVRTVGGKSKRLATNERREDGRGVELNEIR